MDRWTRTGPLSVPMRAIRRPGGLPWIPFRWIRRMYPPGAWEDLKNIFAAYWYLHSILDIEGIASSIQSRTEDDPCRRCGRCCAELLPEPVDNDRMLFWMDAGNPVHVFHAPITEGPRADRFHTGWYYNGARLRMCPLLLRNPATGNKFCSVYHFGPGHRPPGCEGFRPNWPHCEVSQRPLVP